MAETLTAERIMDAAEQVLRRFGPAKATVVDVARALGVSHGSVYRHFASKAELRDAVMERWLKRTSDPLAAFMVMKGPADVRLRQWFAALMAGKREKAVGDAEMFAVSRALFADIPDVVAGHVAALTGQIKVMLDQGVSEGRFEIADTAAAAAAIFDATQRFHNPQHAQEWSDPDIDAAFERVWALVMAGIKSRAN